MGTIRIPNPAAKITAFFGWFSFINVFVFSLNSPVGESHFSSCNSFTTRFTNPNEYPD